MSDSFATPLTVAHQSPLSVGFPRQEYWSGLPFPSPGDLPDPGIEPASPALAGGFLTTESPRKTLGVCCCSLTKSGSTLCDPMDCRRPDFPVLHHLPELAQSHVHWVVCVLVAQLWPTLCDSHGLQPTRLLCPWDFPDKDAGVGCRFLLQGIFPTQGLNPGLLHRRHILYQLSYKGSPS